VYREEYGGEIGSSRWLRQFNGLSGTDRVSPKTNIDAISGATISVRSMTRSVDNLLQTVGKLQENRVL
jgi:Na+-translocating ferredoxin:NAD+ oxidoreductase RnfG subunit